MPESRLGLKSQPHKGARDLNWARRTSVELFTSRNDLPARVSFRAQMSSFQSHSQSGLCPFKGRSHSRDYMLGAMRCRGEEKRAGLLFCNSGLLTLGAFFSFLDFFFNFHFL